MPDIFEVKLSKNAKKDLLGVPNHIRIKLFYWIDAVSTLGLIEISKIKGFHDEPLKGNRVTQRSIRLNKSYRAIYKIISNYEIEFIEIIEVNNHDY
jgi:proteic killer suppression protein